MTPVRRSWFPSLASAARALVVRRVTADVSKMGSELLLAEEEPVWGTPRATQRALWSLFITSAVVPTVGQPHNRPSR